ncbi:MFS transporter [Intestinibacter bartlettii]|uniref:MFS transporter n=1 Tax=Intestinibacter bartlettii TaxID=261299 RepID=A0ABS6DW32_9FIRM|nr:MFS transporter [Intestinibacter bartlettii]MBU5335907.1 MFS transporter [Intestinibacter bartlettii]
MSNGQTQQTVAIPLPKAKKNLVQIGCICMMLSVAMYGLVFSTLTAPILESVNAMGYVGLFSIFAALGVTIMTPIGGKLGDIIGRRNIVVIPGILCVICGIAFAFVRSLVPLMVLRLLISLTQGAFTAAPYIIMGLINERKDVPKAMGMLAAAIAVGGFGGSIIAGILTDMNMLTVAILMPALPLILGIVLIGLNMPNQKREGKVTVDVPGIIALSVTLCAILLSLNFGSAIGWTNPVIIAGFALGLIAFYALIKVEKKAVEPLIPLALFRNKNYTMLLAVGFASYFYQNAMNVYAPIGAMQVMGKSASIAGTLQMPRTLLTIIVPIIAGTWVGKKTSNMWKAMVGATALAGIPMLVMGFTTPSTSILVYIVALTVTGIAESFRSVSITPAAQSMLEPKDIGVGTSFVNFFNSLSGTVAATVFAVAYNMNTAADPTNVEFIQNGVNAVYWVAAIVGLVGLAIVILFVRPQMSDKKETEQSEQKVA